MRGDPRAGQWLAAGSPSGALSLPRAQICGLAGAALEGKMPDCGTAAAGTAKGSKEETKRPGSDDSQPGSKLFMVGFGNS